MRHIDTTRFGTLEIDEERIIHFSEGLLGFSDSRDFIILEHKPDSPFCWMQSVEAPELAFVLANPFLIKKDYLEALSSKERDALADTDQKNIIVLVIATIPPGDAQNTTVNLLGPLVINMKTRQGKQVIFANSGYSHCHSLLNHS